MTEPLSAGAEATHAWVVKLARFAPTGAFGRELRERLAALDAARTLDVEALLTEVRDQMCAEWPTVPTFYPSTIADEYRDRVLARLTAKLQGRHAMTEPLSAEELPGFARYHRALPHDDGVPHSACMVCRLLAALDAARTLDVEALDVLDDTAAWLEAEVAYPRPDPKPGMARLAADIRDAIARLVPAEDGWSRDALERGTARGSTAANGGAQLTVPAEDEPAEQIRCTNCGAIRAWDDEFGWTHIFDATPEPIDDPGPIETVARKRGSI